MTVLLMADLVAGALVGLKSADVDQLTDLLLHRSIFTHGPLVPQLLYLM